MESFFMVIAYLGVIASSCCIVYCLVKLTKQFAFFSTPKAKWRITKEHDRIVCSRCGYTRRPSNISAGCPRCGAKMLNYKK